jgi:hypothetical protein
VGFIADKGDDHAVEVEEEHEQVETELDERFLCGVSTLCHCAMRILSCKEAVNRVTGCCLYRVSYLLVYVELPEDFRCVQKVLVLKNPAMVSLCLGAMLPTDIVHTSFRSKPKVAGSE